MTSKFNPSDLKNLYTPPHNSSGEENGQVTIIGGSELFHGAPLLSLIPASRIVDTVFFSSPYKPLQNVADNIKSKLLSFIWVPWNQIEKYIEKSDAVLIGPGFMRYKSESNKVFDSTGRRTKHIVDYLLHEFPKKKWVIDAGALQTMNPKWIPRNAIITPNRKEFSTLFGIRTKIEELRSEQLQKLVELYADKHSCVIVLKGPMTIVSDGIETVLVEGGNAGLTKGGTGDVLAGLTVALLAKNDPMLAATCASYLIKKAADELFKKVGTNYNADDVAKKIPETMSSLV
jgi:hydroxyethylthiazole kinase-like uncharacterized protein yjeF